MDEEIVESAELLEPEFDMDSAVDDLGSELFGETDENDEQNTDHIEETVDEDDEGKDESGNSGAKEASSDDETKEPSVEARTAPQSWKKDMHEAWGKLDKDTQDYIETRESQMREGLSKDRDDADLGKVMRDTMSPYTDFLKTQDVDEPNAVKYLMSAHYRLSTASPEEKVGLIQQMAQSYGISLTDEKGEVKDVDPQILNMQNQINGLQSSIKASHESTLQVARDKVVKDVEAFASSHDHFDEISDDIAKFISAGYELEDAYEKAVWANPITREKEMSKSLEAKQEKIAAEKQKELEKAKKAKVVNVKGRNTRKVPTAPIGTMEDTLKETYREIQTRS